MINFDIKRFDTPAPPYLLLQDKQNIPIQLKVDERIYLSWEIKNTHAFPGFRKKVLDSDHRERYTFLSREYVGHEERNELVKRDQVAHMCPW